MLHAWIKNTVCHTMQTRLNNQRGHLHFNREEYFYLIEFFYIYLWSCKAEHVSFLVFFLSIIYNEHTMCSTF